MESERKFGPVEITVIVLAAVGGFVVLSFVFGLGLGVSGQSQQREISYRMNAAANARGITQFLAIQAAQGGSLQASVRLADGNEANTPIQRFQALARLGLDPKIMVHRGDSREAWDGLASPGQDPMITADHLSFAIINHESAFWQGPWSESPSTPIIVDRNTSGDADSPESVWSGRQPWEGVVANSDGSAIFERTGAVMPRAVFPGDGRLINFHLFSGRHDNGHAPQVRMINP